MNLSAGPHHNMWTSRTARSTALTSTENSRRRRSEAGYTLVALLALMTVMALLAMAAAPSIRHRSQREREIETIYRGEQVADAIRLYYNYQVRQGRSGVNGLPTSMEQLLEGVSFGTKKIHVLRPSAARELLSQEGEWKLVRPRSAQLTDFTRSIMLYADNVRPPTNDPQLKLIETLMAPVVIATNNLETSSPSSAGDDSSSGPFIGVTIDSKADSVLAYYGVERHDGWIFTPLFR